jgi:2-polyprenyl-6-methoxyphenol hydroxylase-like FAD-dependent oxidoreductase
MLKHRRAVIVGGSVAGLLAAAVLSRHYDEVVVLEQDTFGEDIEPRDKVPQAHHVHLLLQRGKQAIESLLPGFLSDLERGGSVVADLSHDVKWFHAGRWKNRWPTGLTAQYCTRTLLEQTLRRRITGFANVRLKQNIRVERLQFVAGRVAGVEASQGDGHVSFDSDFTIDASGRGSHVEEWLPQGGFEPPSRELIPTHLGYVSRIYRARAELRDKWRVLLIFPRLPHDRKLCVISPIEGGRWMVTAGGWFGNYPDVTPSAFESFIRSLPVQDAWNALAGAEPLGPPRRYTMVGGQRRVIDFTRPWPRDFIVLGDALCSFNPIYSQGMTVCALEAEALARHLLGYRTGACDIRTLQQSIAAVAGVSWDQAKSQELRFPELAPSPSIRERVRTWYLDRLIDASAFDRRVLKSMLEVNNLVAPPSNLFHIAMVGAALKPRPRGNGLGGRS